MLTYIVFCFLYNQEMLCFWFVKLHAINGNGVCELVTLSFEVFSAKSVFPWSANTLDSHTTECILDWIPRKGRRSLASSNFHSNGNSNRDQCSRGSSYPRGLGIIVFTHRFTGFRVKYVVQSSPSVNVRLSEQRVDGHTDDQSPSQAEIVRRWIEPEWVGRKSRRGLRWPIVRAGTVAKTGVGRSGRRSATRTICVASPALIGGCPTDHRWPRRWLRECRWWLGIADFRSHFPATTLGRWRNRVCNLNLIMQHLPL